MRRRKSKQQKRESTDRGAMPANRAEWGIPRKTRTAAQDENSKGGGHRRVTIEQPNSYMAARSGKDTARD